MLHIVFMHKTKNLENICHELVHYIPNWKAIIHRLKDQENISPEKPLSIDQYKRLFSRAYLRMSLENASSLFPKDLIDINLISKDIENKDYKFSVKDNNSIYVKSKHDKTNFVYDSLTMIDDTPCIINIKLSRWKGINKKSTSKRSKTIKDSLLPRTYNRLLRPLKHYFSSDVGYALMIPRDEYSKRKYKRDRSTRFHQFEDSGGIIIPFYTSRENYNKHAKEIIKEEDLPLR